MPRKKLTVKRKGYTRKDGTKVKATTYKVADRGKKGRGPKDIKLKSGGLGGTGYLKRSTMGRKQKLGASVNRDGYATTMRRLTALGNLGTRTMTDAQRRKINADKRWLKKKHGGK